MSEFKLIEHSSDIGMEVISDSVEGIFDEGIRGFYSTLFARLELTGETRAFILESSGSDLADLAVDFFNELIYLCETDASVLREITRVNEGDLKIEGTVYEFDRKASRFSKIIKAATYHGLEFTKSKGIYRLRMIFDV